MSEVRELTYQDVAEHNTKNDLWMVIEGKVYDCTKFLDEHPGGEEVLLDVGGQDATEAFDDVGHSDEARESLDVMLVGQLKSQPGAKGSKKSASSTSGSSSDSGLGLGMYLGVLIVGAIGYFGYNYLEAQKQAQVQV
ncbi:putative cytochrome b5 [Ceratocystis fimbriata CBS 114723]|uniref:Putative cytochrome b5 n=1 Tax=Ceratocystis fimbriata CBS 114723 TaxID=1035309 RepID=A0A2C5WZG1_9PEZI|nr:putative cytochrome b5 [Ceratocystis fimbriata CBS 114723]